MDKNHFNLYRVSFVCLSILTLVLPALAEANSLEIKCQDSAGNPLTAVTVQIQQLGGKPKDKKTEG